MSQAFFIIYHQSQFSEDWILLLVSSTAALERFFHMCFCCLQNAGALRWSWQNAHSSAYARDLGTLGPWNLHRRSQSQSACWSGARQCEERSPAGAEMAKWLNMAWYAWSIGPFIRFSLMICHDLPWFTVIYQFSMKILSQLPCFIMIYQFRLTRLGFTMIYQFRFTMIYHDLLPIDAPIYQASRSKKINSDWTNMNKQHQRRGVFDNTSWEFFQQFTWRQLTGSWTNEGTILGTEKSHVFFNVPWSNKTWVYLPHDSIW